MFTIEEREHIAKNDQLSYAAAEILGSQDLERVSYYPKKGWFIKRWQAILLVIVITTLIYFAFRAGESSYYEQGVNGGVRTQWDEHFAPHPRHHRKPPLEEENFTPHPRHRNNNVTSSLILPPQLSYSTRIISSSEYNQPTDTTDSKQINGSKFYDQLKYRVEPIHYDVYIQPFIDDHSGPYSQFSFVGNVSIILHTKEEVNYISIGVAGLQITPKMYTLKSYDDATNTWDIEKSIGVTIYRYDENAGTVVLALRESVTPLQKYLLEITFEGKINALPYGLFHSADGYLEKDKKSCFVATNTAAPFARAIFPCFDVPDQKATFRFTIGRKSTFILESSVLEWESEKTIGAWKWSRSRKTNPYPVHFIDFVVTCPADDVRVTINVTKYNAWSSTTQAAELEYVKELTLNLIANLEYYLRVLLPSTMLNIFAVPIPFVSRKSNLGIIYATPTDILVKPQGTSEIQKQHVALVTSSHIVQEWVEGLVNFQLEEDEWIKESLVDYLKYVALSFSRNKKEPTILAKIDDTRTKKNVKHFSRLNQRKHWSTFFEKRNPDQNVDHKYRTVERQWDMMTNFYLDVQQVEMNNEMENAARSSTFNAVFKKQSPFPVKEVQTFKRTNLSPTTNVEENDILTPLVYNKLRERKATDKGACLFRMIHHMITEPVFIGALGSFLQNSIDKFVKGDDLWDAMTVAARKASYPGYQLLPQGISIKSILEDWIHSEGYPILTVSRDYSNNTITFSQRIHRTPQERNELRSHYWHVPISFTTENEALFSATAPRIWLQKTAELTIESPVGLTRDQWILVNPLHTAFCRVQYDITNWYLLKGGLKKIPLPDIIRAQLLDDALFFGRKGMLDYSFSLDLTRQIADFGEQRYEVWVPVLRHLNYIRNLISFDDGQELKTAFTNYAQWLIMPAYKMLESKHEETHNLIHNEKRLRGDLFLWACAMDAAECRLKARTEFNKWKTADNPDDVNPIDPDMRYPILCTIIRFGTLEDYTFLRGRLYEKAARNDLEDLHIYLKSLLCHSDAIITEDLLNYSLKEHYGIVSLNTIEMLWVAVAETFYSSEVPFNFMIRKWDDIKLRYSEYQTVVTAIVVGATTNIHSSEARNKLKVFTEQNAADLPYLEKTLADATRSVEDKIAWKTGRMAVFADWLYKNMKLNHFVLT